MGENVKNVVICKITNSDVIESYSVMNMSHHNENVMITLLYTKFDNPDAKYKRQIRISRVSK